MAGNAMFQRLFSKRGRQVIRRGKKTYEPPRIIFIKWWNKEGWTYGEYWSSKFCLDDMTTQGGAQNWLDTLPCKRGYTTPEDWGYPLPLEARNLINPITDKQFRGRLSEIRETCEELSTLVQKLTEEITSEYQWTEEYSTSPQGQYHKDMMSYLWGLNIDVTGILSNMVKSRDDLEGIEESHEN